MSATSGHRRAADDPFLASMLERLVPTPEEHVALDEAVQALLAQARAIAQAFRAEGRATFAPLVVGSVAKDTWLHGRADIDLFLMFPEDLGRGELEACGLEAGHRLIDRPVLRYAEHPYVHGTWRGYDADIVPAHEVASAEAIKSAVDRTPYHNAFVIGRMAEHPVLKDEIRLMKAWLTGIRCYGAETSLGAISGYLAEVLVIHHGGFLAAIDWFAQLRPGTRIDPSGRSDEAFAHEPLVVIDPVDPGRNAASAVTEATIGRLARAANAFRVDPHERFFDPLPLAPLPADMLPERLGDGAVVVVDMAAPQMREDARVPHLMRAADNLGRHLVTEGFEIAQTSAGLVEDDARAWLMLEATNAELEPERVHLGPPPEIEDRAREFCAKYATDPRLIEGPAVVKVHGHDRVYVRLRNDERGLVDRTRLVLERSVRLGKHVDIVREQLGARTRDLAALIDDEDDPHRDALVQALSEALATVDSWDWTGEPMRDYARADRP